MVKLLIEHGCDPTARDNIAIIRAARIGHLEMVKFLVEQGCDATAQDNEAIREAVYHDHLPVVKFLLDKGCDKDQAIAYATRNNNSKMIEFLGSL